MAESAPRETARAGSEPTTAREGPEGSAPEPGAERPRRRGLLVLLVLLLVAAGIWIAWQGRSNRALEARVGELSRELSATRQELSAYRGHLGDVRARVADLRSRLSELDEVVRRDPTAAPAPDAAD